MAYMDVAGQHQRLDTVEGERRRGNPIGMSLDNIENWTQWKGREDEEGL